VQLSLADGTKTVPGGQQQTALQHCVGGQNPFFPYKPTPFGQQLSELALHVFPQQLWFALHSLEVEQIVAPRATDANKPPANTPPISFNAFRRGVGPARMRATSSIK
jgi:hypothetical protein